MEVQPGNGMSWSTVIFWYVLVGVAALGGYAFGSVQATKDCLTKQAEYSSALEASRRETLEVRAQFEKLRAAAVVASPQAPAADDPVYSAVDMLVGVPKGTTAAVAPMVKPMLTQANQNSLIWNRMSSCKNNADCVAARLCKKSLADPERAALRACPVDNVNCWRPILATCGAFN